MIQGKKILSIIPARSGSKRLKDKNVKLLGNKPLIAYTIEASKNSKYVDKTVFSADSKEYAEIAKKFGAETLIRPKELADDDSSSISVILHALKHYPDFDIICFLQPTSPFRKSKHIDEGLEKVLDADGILAVTNDIQGSKWLVEEVDGFLKPASKESKKLYRINGSLYIAKKEYYDKATDKDYSVPLENGKIKPVFMSKEESLDIDTEQDWKLAEFLNSG